MSRIYLRLFLQQRLSYSRELRTQETDDEITGYSHSLINAIRAAATRFGRLFSVTPFFEPQTAETVAKQKMRIWCREFQCPGSAWRQASVSDDEICAVASDAVQTTTRLWFMTGVPRWRWTTRPDQVPVDQDQRVQFRSG